MNISENNWREKKELDFISSIDKEEDDSWTPTIYYRSRNYTNIGNNTLPFISCLFNTYEYSLPFRSRFRNLEDVGRKITGIKIILKRIYFRIQNRSNEYTCI